MKITCEREKLLSAFQAAAAVAPARSPKPILQNLKIEASGSTATLLGTDLEIGIRVVVEGIQCEAPGSALLPIGRVGQILREASDTTLHLETEGDGTVIRGERFEFRLPGENPEAFPAVSTFEESAYLELPARLMRELIRRTVFATDNESSRYALSGVLLEYDGQKITAVGTDGRRLAVMEAPAQSVGGYKLGDVATIVPARAMQLIERTLTDHDAEVQLAAAVNHVLLRSPRVTIYSRLVEGRFPKWRDVFPKREGAQKIDMVIGQLYSAVRQAAIVTSDDNRGVDFSFDDGKLTLAARAADLGQSHVELPIAYDGAKLEITLDPRYFADFLKVLDPDKTCSVELKDAESAAIARTDDGYGYVIMPLARDR